MRIGLGFDIHPLVKGRPFKLGGVLLPSDKGPQGHSDGDCLLHAITDAIFGAAGLGDMGRHFPDTDPKWKNANSAIFLQEARKLIAEKRLRIENLDANLHLEAPKLAPFLEEMKKNIAALLGISLEQVNLKAKRGEGLDAVGRGEAVAAQVVVLCL
ncbi:MAG: 2-C-methyl-D-erythritol 2,4-cyclodiphosphate synthase [Deltaproteobacteria bacterium]|nr:2-C-methyl-D-erythritol 2,4-cyclodiphosphate synthase [Deltaproteobacteria bacterium]